MMLIGTDVLERCLGKFQLGYLPSYQIAISRYTTMYLYILQFSSMFIVKVAIISFPFEIDMSITGHSSMDVLELHLHSLFSECLSLLYLLFIERKKLCIDHIILLYAQNAQTINLTSILYNQKRLQILHMHHLQLSAIFYGSTIAFGQSTAP